MKKKGELKIEDEMKERGIYTGGNKEDFESEETIKRRLALEGDLPNMETPIPTKKDFEYWSSRFRARQAQWKETSQVEKNHVVINFKKDVIINFIGDIHAGSPWTDYRRIHQEIEAIANKPNSYVILGGDLVDGYFFNPAQMEQIEQTPEQVAYMQSLIDYLAKEKRLLVAFGGDHDGWSKKMGIDPYYDMPQRTGAYYMHGVGYVELNVGDENYRLIGSHRLPGHSMYNNVHPEMRLSREVQGGDLYFGCHTHTKGYAQQAIKGYGDNSKKVHFLSVGPYKSMDNYSRKKGWTKQSEKEMYGSAVRLHSKNKIITYYDSVLEANS